MPKALDLTNYQTNHIRFLYKTGINSHGDALWLVECDCGKQWNIPAYRYKRIKGCRSCSVIGRKQAKGSDHASWTGYGEISGKHWKSIIRHAKDRGLKIEITIEQAWDQFVDQNHKCALTGVKLIHGQDQTASLDRIDSSRSYSKDNIQWVHKTLNFMKHSLGEDEFVDWCMRVVEYKGVYYPLLVY